jgi:hypothetical protein
LRYLSGPAFKELSDLCQMVCKQLEALLRTMEAILLQEEAEKLARRRVKRRK